MNPILDRVIAAAIGALLAWLIACRPILHVLREARS